MLFNNLFPIVDKCLSCEDTARQSCAIVRRWPFLRHFASFLRPVFPASRVRHIPDLHSKFALGHTMCRSLVDIHSATADIRRGKKKIEDRRKKAQDENIMPASAKQGGHNTWIYTPKIAIHRTSKGHFLNDIIGYDRLKLYLKIYIPKK